MHKMQKTKKEKSQWAKEQMQHGDEERGEGLVGAIRERRVIQKTTPNKRPRW